MLQFQEKKRKKSPARRVFFPSARALVAQYQYSHTSTRKTYKLAASEQVLGRKGQYSIDFPAEYDPQPPPNLNDDAANPSHFLIGKITGRFFLRQNAVAMSAYSLLYLRRFSHRAASAIYIMSSSSLRRLLGGWGGSTRGWGMRRQR